MINCLRWKLGDHPRLSRHMIYEALDYGCPWTKACFYLNSLLNAQYVLQPHSFYDEGPLVY